MTNDRDDAFHAKLKLLNALHDEYMQWEWTTARKKHTDLFGDIIEEREDYLKRSTGPAYDELLKLSQRSAERMLDALFDYNHIGTSLCERIAAERDRRHMEAMKSAVDALDKSHDKGG